MAYVLFISEERLKDSTTIGLNVDTELLLPYIKQSQKLYVETKLGTDLNNKLKDLIQLGTVNNVGNEAYATLLNDYIAEILTIVRPVYGTSFFTLQNRERKHLL